MYISIFFYISFILLASSYNLSNTFLKKYKNTGIFFFCNLFKSSRKDVGLYKLVLVMIFKLKKKMNEI